MDHADGRLLLLGYQDFRRHLTRQSKPIVDQQSPVREKIMIDAHIHISDDEFNEDVDNIVAEAKMVGVKAMVAVAEKLEDFQKIIDLSQTYKNFITPALGLHPVKPGSHDTESRSVTLEDYQIAEVFLREHHNLLVAIGEVGLDFTPYNVKSSNDKEVQRKVFSKQIQLAQEFGLPLNVHSRSAGRPTIQTLISEGATAVLLHAFDGKVSVARQGVEAGFYFSVPPSIVRSDQKQRLVKAIPLSNLLLETDAPALGPERQIRNEAKNIEISCQEIARLKDVSVEEVKKSTTANALKLFPRLINLYNIPIYEDAT